MTHLSKGHYLGSILIVSLLVLILTATGFSQTSGPFYLKSGQPYEGEEIAVLLHEADALRAIQKRTSQFEELTGIKVKYIWTPYPALHEKIMSGLIAGAGRFDVVNNLDPWIGENGSYMIDMQPFVNEDEALLDYPEVLLEMSKYEGKLVAIPFRSHTQFLFYRTDIFNQLGLEAPDTWGDVESAGHKIQENTDLHGIAMYYGRVSPTAMHNLFIWFPMLRGLGGRILNEKMEPVFNSDIGVKATARYIGFMLEHEITPIGSVAWDEYGAVLSLVQGKSAMWPNWEYIYPLAQDPERSRIVGKFNVTTIPRWENRERWSTAITHQWSIPSDSKHQKAAWEYVKWASSAALIKEMILAGESIIANRVSNLLDGELNAKFDNLFKTKYEGFKIGGPLPNWPEWSEVSNILSRTISEIATGMPVDVALNAAAEETQEIMERAGYYN